MATYLDTEGTKTLYNKILNDVDKQLVKIDSNVDNLNSRINSITGRINSITGRINSHATTTTLGGIKASNVLTTSQALTSGNGTTAGRYYGVQVDANGIGFVNIPWTDTPTASNTVVGGIKVINTTNANINTETYSNSMSYGVSINTNNVAYVSVPIVSSTTYGLIKADKTNDTIDYSEVDNGNYYKLQTDINGLGYVKIPATNSAGATISVASNNVLGGFKTGYKQNGKKYAVNINTSDSKAYVNVPWENTTYNAGTGICIGDNNDFYINCGTGIEVSNNELRLKPAGKTNNGSPDLNLGGVYIIGTNDTDTYDLPSGLNISNKGAISVLAGAGLKLDSQDNNLKLDTATISTIGGIKIAEIVDDYAAVEDQSRLYKVKIDRNGIAFVNVPWTDTIYTLPAANNTELGGIKTNYENNDKNYAVQVTDDGNAFVNVPWENTTYDLIEGIKPQITSTSDTIILEHNTVKKTIAPELNITLPKNIDSYWNSTIIALNPTSITFNSENIFWQDEKLILPETHDKDTYYKFDITAYNSNEYFISYTKYTK